MALIQCGKKRNVAIGENKEETLKLCCSHFIAKAQEAISIRGTFSVALSGGSTPKTIYSMLSKSPYREQIDWQKVFLFWSDERCVPPNDPESNYHMAMTSGLQTLSIPPDHIFPFKTMVHIPQSAEEYDLLLKNKVGGVLDLVLLGMGEDGHTASLFPHTEGLLVTDKLAIVNDIPQKKTHRLTLTFTCINQARNSVIYLFGENKSAIAAKALLEPDDIQECPVQGVGTEKHPALWIMDNAAASDFCAR